MDPEIQELESALTTLIGAVRDDESLQPELVSNLTERLANRGVVQRHARSQRFDQIMILSACAQIVLLAIGALILAVLDNHSSVDGWGRDVTTFNWMPLLIYVFISVAYGWGFGLFWVVRREGH